MTVTELTRNRWVIFKLGDYFGVQFWGNTFYGTTFCCSSGKYRSFLVTINEIVQLKMICLQDKTYWNMCSIQHRSSGNSQLRYNDVT